MLTFSILPRKLVFRFAAGTSRGVYTERKTWFVVARDSQTNSTGIGECAPLPQLSCDDLSDYTSLLCSFAQRLSDGNLSLVPELRNYPSMLMGFETALAHLSKGSFALSQTPFASNDKGITINGLVWMGSYELMAERLEEKISQGFRCIKIKIGAIDFDKEMALLERIRRDFGSDRVELRVDANGAFAPSDALRRLDTLARFDLHSIEQPIRAGQWEEMSRLCRLTPVPIALDEELIGVNDPARKRELLDIIRPHYIILKPTLHGGFRGTDEWIDLAEERNVGWWATSALESNIGLNAIAHWAAEKNVAMPQGLGTGQLFESNAPLPLKVVGDQLHFDPLAQPQIDTILRWIEQPPKQ